MDEETMRAADPVRRSLLAMAAIGPVLAANLAGVPAAAQTGGSALPPELRRAWDAYNRATMANDVATLADLVADDYMLVNSDTSVQDKPSYLADFAVPGFRLDPYEIEQPLGRAWSDTALTGGLFNLGWTQEGQAHQRRRLRIAHVWTRRDGRWQIAYTQLTRVPEQGG